MTKRAATLGELQELHRLIAKSLNQRIEQDIEDNIPDVVVEITVEQHSELLEGQVGGKRIVADDYGFPILADPLPPTNSEVQEAQTAASRAYLASTDWYVMRFMETGVAIPEDVTLKRQQAQESIQ